MLRESQKIYIQNSFTNFALSLTRNQLQQLHHRLNNLAQYGPESLDVAYATVAKLLELSEEKRSRLIE